MQNLEKRTYFLSLVKAVKGNKEAKVYLRNYYTNKIHLSFFDAFSLENIKKWDIESQVKDIQTTINANK
jgi:hypothetical protein